MKKEFRAAAAVNTGVILCRTFCSSLPNARRSPRPAGWRTLSARCRKSLAKLGIDATQSLRRTTACIKDKYAYQVEHMFDFYAKLGWRQAIRRHREAACSTA